MVYYPHGHSGQTVVKLAVMEQLLGFELVISKWVLQRGKIALEICKKRAGVMTDRAQVNW